MFSLGRGESVACKRMRYAPRVERVAAFSVAMH
jgi:hypothetical protein